MSDLTSFFENALAERGVDARVTDNDSSADKARYLVNPIDDRPLVHHISIDTRGATRDEIKKEIAHRALHVAQNFKGRFANTFRWGDRKSVTTSPYDGGWAECNRCETRVEIPSGVDSAAFIEDAELSTPQPSPRDHESALSSIDDFHHSVVKMYLVGRLRERCDTDCPNSEQNTSEMGHSYSQGYDGNYSV